MTSRRGAVLIIAVGMAGMLAALIMAFLVRMRGDAQSAQYVVRLAQSRLMLHAALSYVQEASRLGYAQINPVSGLCTDPREGYGWIDPRDPSVIGRAAEAVAFSGRSYLIGPRDRTGNPLWTAGTWPAVGTSMRAPMYRHVRPRYAVRPDMTPNAIPSAESRPETFGIPFLIRTDPTPEFDPSLGIHNPVSAPQRLSWVRGDAEVITGSAGLGWFRVYRETGGEADRPIESGPPGATFIITVGDGVTEGWRDWAEVMATPGAWSAFGDNIAMAASIYEQMSAAELRMWYRVEWSPAVGGNEDVAYMVAQHVDSNRDYHPNIGAGVDKDSFYSSFPVNASGYISAHVNSINSPSLPRNFVGTFRYIQRLKRPPDGGAW